MIIFVCVIKIVASQQGNDPMDPMVPEVPSIKLEPARSYLHPGDSIVVDCKSSSADSIVTWKREGAQPLPSNIRVSTNYSLNSRMNLSFIIELI